MFKLPAKGTRQNYQLEIQNVTKCVTSGDF